MEVPVWAKVVTSVGAVLWIVVLTSLCQLWMKRKHFNGIMARQGVPIMKEGDWITGQGFKLVQMMRRVRRPDISFYDQAKPHNIEPTIQPFYSNQRKIYGKTFLYWIGSEPALHAMNPEIVRAAFMGQSKTFERSEKARNLLGELAGFNNMASAEGDIWHKKRAFLAPFFFPDRVKGMLRVLLASSLPVLERWEMLVKEGGGKAEIVVDQEMVQISSDVICRTAFGSTYSKGKKFYDNLNKMTLQAFDNYLIHNTVPGFRFVPTSTHRLFWKLKRETSDIVLGIVKERQTALKNGRVSEEERNDLLTSMLSSNLNVVDESRMLLISGSETTARFMTWILILLAMYPAWQEKAYAEVMAQCGIDDPTIEAISSFKIIPLILMEVLRLYPPVANVTQEAQADVQVANQLMIPKGVNVFINVIAMHHDKDLWGPDAGEFRPDRFANGLSKACKHPMGYIPFGAGPRVCFGQHLSLTEAKVLLSLTLQRFSLSLPSNARCEPTMGISLHPRYPVPIIFTARAQASSAENP